MKCEDCVECEFYAEKRPDIPHSWKPSKTLSESVADKKN